MSIGNGAADLFLKGAEGRVTEDLEQKLFESVGGGGFTAHGRWFFIRAGRVYQAETRAE